MCEEAKRYVGNFLQAATKSWSGFSDFEKKYFQRIVAATMQKKKKKKKKTKTKKKKTKNKKTEQKHYERKTNSIALVESG